MEIEKWGVIARSRSTQLQIRKKLTVPFDNPVDANTAALAFQAELNAAAKFGLTDWVGVEDAVEGGPHEPNPTIDTTVSGGTSTVNHMGMNGQV